jgi:hypothetical protein
MVDDVRHAFDIPLEEELEPTTQAFFDMLTAFNKPLHGHTQVLQLDTITCLLVVKSQFSRSIAYFDAFLVVIGTLLPDGHKLPPNMYESKKLLITLKMSYEMMHVCSKQYMLFRNEHANNKYCVKCGSSRYIEVDSSNVNKKQLTVPIKVLRYLPFLPRLQRLYMFEDSVKQITWHKHGHRYHPNKIVHLSDGEAWKAFDMEYKDFGSEARNVRVAITTDGFNPYGMGAASYNYWPVFIIPLNLLNLPPGVCMQRQNILLSLVVLGSEQPGKNMGMYMEPLVDELMFAWEVGILAYDRATRQNFITRVAYHTSMHDFPAYGIFCGWCIHGKMSCLIYREVLRCIPHIYAHLVVQGFSQVQGLNFGEIFASVARLEAIRILLDFTASKRFKLYQMDVKSVLLNGVIQKEGFARQPPGFDSPKYPNRVYKLFNVFVRN